MRSVQPVFLAASLLLAAACADSGTSAEGGADGGSDESTGPGTEEGTTGGEDASMPTDSSADAIAEFIAAEGYKGEGWTPETDGPREESSPVSPHDRVRVWLNDALVASHADGDGEVGGTPLDANSMAVKEIHDDADAVVGHAVFWKTEEGSAFESVTYWCYGPAGRCVVDAEPTTPDAPEYGVGLDVDCGACHGTVVFTHLP